MKNDDRELVKKLMRQSISKAEFNGLFSENIEENPKYIIQLLEEAYENREADDVDYALFVGFTFDVFTEDVVAVLCKLIESSWHYQHENIAMILQRLKSPESIPYLYRTALMKFNYLDFDESYALAVKCIWALGDINTIESREKLQLLAQSENDVIRSNATKQLTR
ncbi:conserved hypothetical protein [Paenibacillus curdlanolyticus YK9]|uniref:HEAT repeat domain-containing protein n=1 Tax=Paenibacillus curdlanolyticus YK9 TaxID=717606 RepID=E0IET0_9BACL|nr:HEAT repeat domain-containing protein [Paenibacillus curdlanolyticus]EFM09168.1 conserved hypothetical protein [Paenibacillus curdlanolyticus YK9]